MSYTYEKLGRVRTESVHKCTGKHWDEWVKILDKVGGRGMEHKELVHILKTKYKLSLWWQQGVAIGYETAIGKRVEGKTASGYNTVATKNIPVPQAAAWKFLLSEEGLAIWLRPVTDFEVKRGKGFETENGTFGEVRTFKPKARIRMTWGEEEWLKPSILNIGIVSRPKGKCVMVFQHEGLPDGRLRLKMREHWKNILNRFAAAVSTAQ